MSTAERQRPPKLLNKIAYTYCSWTFIKSFFHQGFFHLPFIPYMHLFRSLTRRIDLNGICSLDNARTSAPFDGPRSSHSCEHASSRPPLVLLHSLLPHNTPLLITTRSIARRTSSRISFSSQSHLPRKPVLLTNPGLKLSRARRQPSFRRASSWRAIIRSLLERHRAMQNISLANLLFA
jgi:hypothetical protein